jgi:hypothetical protein
LQGSYARRMQQGSPHRFWGGESLNHTRLNLELNEEHRRVPSHQCAQAVVIPDMLRVLYSKTLSSKLADIHSR